MQFLVYHEYVFFLVSDSFNSGVSMHVEKEPVALPNGEGTLVLNNRDSGNFLGVHSCRGGVDWNQLTPEEDVIHCRQCGMRLKVPIGVSRDHEKLRRWCNHALFQERRAKNGFPSAPMA